jgi:hypothetical protein
MLKSKKMEKETDKPNPCAALQFTVIKSAAWPCYIGDCAAQVTFL